MFNKIVSIKHNYTMPNISNDMSITTFGDLHYCSSFDDKRLNLLTEYLFNNDSKYLSLPKQGTPNCSRISSSGR